MLNRMSVMLYNKELNKADFLESSQLQSSEQQGNMFDTQINLLSDKLQQAETELNDIKNSRSYKLGRFLTLIPRKMRESAQKRKQKRLLRKQAKQSQTKGKAQ